MKTKNKPFSNKSLLLKNLIKSGFLISGLLLSSFASFAATTKTSNLPISSTVSNSCVVKSTDNINLGSYNPSSLVNLNGSGVLSLICTKGAIVTASPASGGSSLTGSGGSLSYSLYTDSGMTSKWGTSGTLSSFTGGSGNSAQYSSSLNVYFKNQNSLTGHATVSQLQAAVPGFNPNLFYRYYYDSSSNTTYIMYNYVGQGSSSSPPPGGTVQTDNWIQATTSTAPNTLGYNNKYVVGDAMYLVLPPGTTTGSTGTYGTTYQVPASIGSNPLTATSTTVTQPVNLTYYASLPYGQDVAPGVYTDTVVIQVTF